jgi:hypothetical protein
MTTSFTGVRVRYPKTTWWCWVLYEHARFVKSNKYNWWWWW